ncbi:hypothetical protein [Georgenia yuyongxinii]|uniref:Uncharacterized protein n=1 Tax=Georgenia yuyongxinii TaxID=2589797 RepID=A0A552WUP4_9MICO|nr:hypothetical protein [Georgenia yuyongxinii]TRW46415.1 hypothetical protein FJ693_05670 [Georgenia yuyongxinii]
MTDHPPGWSRLVRAARTHIKNGKNTPTRQALTEQAVRAWVAHTLTNPTWAGTPPHHHAIAGARTLTLVLGHRIATHTATTGWPTLLTRRADLLVPLACSRPTVTGRLRTAQAAGWVRVVRQRGDSGMVVKLGRLRAAERAAVPGLDRVVAEIVRVLLAEPDQVDAVRAGIGPAARLLQSLGHAVWSYDAELSLSALIVLVADAAGVDPAGLGGISPAMVKRSRQLAKTALNWDGTGTGLEAALNARGSAGAYAAHQQALADRAAEKARVRQARVRDQEIRDAISYVLDEIGGAPSPDAEDAGIDGWADELAAMVGAMGLGADDARTARRDLARRLVTAGWDRHGAEGLLDGARAADRTVSEAIGVASEQTGAVPRPKTDQADIDAWAAELGRLIGTMSLDPGQAASAHRDLTARLVRARWATVKAASIAGGIARSSATVHGRVQTRP